MKNLKPFSAIALLMVAITIPAHALNTSKAPVKTKQATASKAAVKASAAAPVAAAVLAPKLTPIGDGSTVASADGKLVWMRCHLGQRWENNNCAGDAKKFDYRDANNEVKRINLSGGYAGSSSWRIPSAEELQTLVFCDQGFRTTQTTLKLANNQSKQLPESCDGEKYLRPTIDPMIFPNASKEWVWTSTPDIDKIINMWGVNFESGSFAPISRHHQASARAVRNAK